MAVAVAMVVAGVEPVTAAVVVGGVGVAVVVVAVVVVVAMAGTSTLGAGLLDFVDADSVGS